jgi:hypothetical protein
MNYPAASSEEYNPCPPLADLKHYLELTIKISQEGLSGVKSSKELLAFLLS